VGTSFGLNGGSVRGNSLPALENRIALAEAAAETLATGGSPEFLRERRRAIEDLAVAQGGDYQDVHRLLRELFKPRQVGGSHG
jgi:hypothetical protein